MLRRQHLHFPMNSLIKKSVDDGVLIGFYRMNAFLSLEKIPSIHFHDLEKNVTEEGVHRYQQQYVSHLKQFFTNPRLAE